MTQAGFHVSAATGRFDGYLASVRVSGLRAGGKVQFAVQAACMPATTRLAYLAHWQVYPPPGRTVPLKACQAGICPASGGTAGGSRAEIVTQAGSHPSTAAGRFDGYQASIKLGARPGGSKVLFAVQVVCMAAHTRRSTARPPRPGPLAATPRGTWPARPAPSRWPAATARNELRGVRPRLISGQSGEGRRKAPIPAAPQLAVFRIDSRLPG